MNQEVQIERPSPRMAALVIGSTIAAIVGGIALALYWNQFVEWIRATLGPPLHRLHAPLDQFLSGLPMWTAQASAIGLFLLGVIFAWCLPRQFVYLGAPDQARWRDLRIWATAALVPYMIIYLLLGL